MRDKSIEFEVIQTIETKDALFEVLQYPKLAGSSDVRAAEQLFYVGAAGMRLKLVRVTLRNGRLRNEPGTLYYMHGSDLEMKASTGGGVFKALKGCAEPRRRSLPNYRPRQKSSNGLICRNHNRRSTRQ